VYHCAVGPVAVHVANGMFGLVLVEPEEGLPKCDHEYYVMQSEFYTTESDPTSTQLPFSWPNLLDEHPSHVVFNGSVNSLRDEGKLKADCGESVRIYFGNGGPNFTSSFHIIGTIFDKVWREGDLIR
jgi:nitrite reductase (NO-forming)